MKAVGVACMCSFGALPAAAQAPEPVEQLEERVVQVARAEELPVEPLVAKIREGVAKGVPAARIEPAVEALLGRLRQGRSICAAAPSRDCVAIVADGLQVGIDAQRLSALVSDGALGDRQTRLRAIVAVSDLRMRGVDAGRGEVAVRRLIAAGPLALPDLTTLSAQPDGTIDPASMDRALNAAIDREGNFNATSGRADPPGRARGRNREGRGRPDGAGRGRPDGAGRGRPDGAGRGRPESPGNSGR